MLLYIEKKESDSKIKGHTLNNVTGRWHLLPLGFISLFIVVAIHSFIIAIELYFEQNLSPK